jgi:HD-like signal output (HDOD) protein/CheY-like chemotaxis protein
MTQERTRVLFVDDEENVLNGLRRMLHGMRGAWEMVFCDNAVSALDLMAKTSFDVVVSDMRMPGMDGADFLAEVQRRHPATIRLILSGYADDQSIFRTIGPAHAYLAKPCEQQTLIEAISRPLGLRKVLSAEGPRRLIAGLTNLPSVPELFLELERELRSPRASAASVAAIVGRDVAMTAEVLKLTNSAYFSVGAKITSVLQAVRTLGFETIQTLALRVGIFRQFSGSSSTAPLIAALNDYSVAIGGLSEAIARAENCPPAVSKAAHCAGMLSCVGSLVMLDCWPAKYRQALAMVSPTLPLCRAEEGKMGASHATVGAYLLGVWGFSPAIVEAVAFARQPSAGVDLQFSPLTAVHAALALGPSFPLIAPEVAVADPLDTTYLCYCGLADHVARWITVAGELAEG